MEGMLLALLVTVIINLPLWHSLLSEDEWHFPDIITESSDELFYLSRIREVVDGHPSVGNPMIFERREQLYPLGQLWERILALPMQWFGLSIKTVSIGADAVFPMIFITLTWFLSRHILPERRWRLLFIAVIFLGSEIPYWKRTISPQQTIILPLLYLWLFLHPKRAELGRTALRSALIGIMVLSYPFHWTYCFAAETVFFLSLWRHDGSLTLRMKRGLFIAVPFLLIASPVMLQMLALRQDPAYTEMLSRLGLIDRRLPAGPLVLAKISALLLFLRWIVRRPEEKEGRCALTLLLIAGVLVLCQPLLTGKEAEFGNHYARILAFPLTLGGIAAVRAATGRWRMAGTFIALTLAVWMAAATVSVSIREWRQFTTLTPPASEREELKQILTMLNTLPDEQVILTTPEFAGLLTTYTSHYPFTGYEAYMYMERDEELVDRARLQNALLPSTPLALRGVVGTRYANRMLYRQIQCRLGTLVRWSTADCSLIRPDLTQGPSLALPEPLTSAGAMQVLRSRYVSYALLPDPPPVIQSFLIEVESIGGWTLFRVIGKTDSADGSG
jgi:hypothetical protein